MGNDQHGTTASDLAGIPLARKRQLAQDMARAEPHVTGAELAARFRMKPRWGRQQIHAARNGTSGMPLARNERAGADEVSLVTPDGADDVPPGARPERSPHAVGMPRHAAWVERATVIAIATGLTAVVTAPLAVSFHSLAGWGRDTLDLGQLAYIVP